MVVWAVSTTLRSSILLLSVGIDSVFTGNTYSRNPRNPWLIVSHCVENRLLADYITQRWQEMQVPENQKERVNQIAKHIVYEWEDEKFVLRPLQCDASGNVRVRIRDITIWSHPPRDKSLYRALEKKFPEFNRKKGDLKRDARSIIKMANNDNIPQENKAENLQQKKKKLGENFTNYYEFFEFLKKKGDLPPSYQFPTLQLELQANETDAQPDRYGGASSGVYQANDPEAHHIFANFGYQARGLPSQEAVFNDLFKDLGLSYAEIVEGQCVNATSCM